MPYIILKLNSLLTTRPGRKWMQIDNRPIYICKLISNKEQLHGFLYMHTVRCLLPKQIIFEANMKLELITVIFGLFNWYKNMI